MKLNPVTIQKAIVPDPRYEQIIDKLVVDGKLDMESSIHESSWDIKSITTYLGLLEYCSNDPLFNSCWGLYFEDHREPWYDYPISLSVSRINDDSGSEPGDCVMRLGITIDLMQWNRPYSFNALKNCYANCCATIPHVTFSDDLDYQTDGFIQLSCIIEDRQSPLRLYFDRLIHCLQQLKLAEQTLLRETVPDEPESLTATFNFPPEIRSACNQYLLYFGQFLEDLGILADTSLKESMNKVLFTVTPRDKDQALDVIYEALDVFLRAPDAELIEEMNEQDFAHYQWKLNMYHLKGQLELAKALLQAKDATIEALKIANYQVPPPQPAPNLPASEKEDEDILGGAVSITKYKAKGFTINLPRIIRKLRRKK